MHTDKIFHAFMFYVFTMLLLKELKFNFKSGLYKHYIIAFFISLLYGGIIEIAQSQLFITRSGDLYDLAANLAGTAFAAVHFFIFYDYKRERKE
ncbi:MAG: VanZ family protein [Bacteroidota bacterium]